MPTKKGGGSRVSQHDKENKASSQRPPSPVNLDVDPAEMFLNVLTKKLRNMEKRKFRLEQLESQTQDGKVLDKDQQEAVGKLPSVCTQVDALKELSKQFEQLHAEQQKAVKKKQKQDEKIQRETERERSRGLIEYTLRIQQLLEHLDDPAKDLLREGLDGVTLNEAELTQIDEFYGLVTPIRPGNGRYEKELYQASEHMLSLYEKSGKEVANTTYADLHKLFEKVRVCEYFDKERVVEDIDDEDEDEEEEEEEEEENVDVKQATPIDYTVVTVPEATKLSDHNADLYQPPPMIDEPLVQSQTISPVPISYVDTNSGGVPVSEDYPQHHSVPSPDFSGLQRPNLSPTGAFTFMRESQVETTTIAAHQLPTDTQQSFPPFTAGPSNSALPLTSTTPTTQSDRLYAPETGQPVVEEKPHTLIGAPVSTPDKPSPVSYTSSNSYHGNGAYNRGGNNGRGRSNTRHPYQRFNNSSNYKENGSSRGDGYRDRGGYGNRSYGGGPGGQNRGGMRGKGRTNYPNNGNRQGGGGGSGGNRSATKFNKQNV